MDDKDIEIEKLKKELTHVKANNANLKERNRILRSRNDLPVDRLPYIIRVDDLEAKCKSLESELNLAKQHIDKLQAQIDGEFDEMTRRGTEAWSGVLNASDWVDELRGGHEH